MDDLLSWIRQIQQGLAIESERGFENLQGRKEDFKSFICRELDKVKRFNLPEDSEYRLKQIACQFETYSNMSLSSRRRLVVEARKSLHSLSKKINPETNIKPPRLNINEDNNLQNSPIEDFKTGLKTPLTNIKGIGPNISAKLEILGLTIVEDLLRYFPRDYVDYSSLKRINDLRVGETATIVASVRRCNGFVSKKNKYLSIMELHLQDVTGRIKITRFFAGRRFANTAFIKGQARIYSPGKNLAISGLVKGGNFGISFQDPIIEIMERPDSSIRSKSIGRLVPVYSLTEGLTADRFRDIVKSVLPYSSSFRDPLTSERLKELSLINRRDAIFTIHSPKDKNLLKAARKRLVFDEFLLLQLGLISRRLKLKSCIAPTLDQYIDKDGLVACFLNLLPFPLTNSQKRVFAEIEDDLSHTEPMSRLLQGDVGSGKTIVAFMSILKAVQSGYQAALMAPTEVLAEQHYRTFCKWLPLLHVNIELLTGSTKRSRRKQILDDLANGSLKILIGTHALLEDPVSFSRLGLVVVDEQHRFGVHQRNRLLYKGLQPHLLAMTATPIPRTLALSLYGDLDISQIDELPPGRTPVKTMVLSGARRIEAYKLIRDQVKFGNRAYVILPLVEESEKLDLRSAVEVHSDLSRNVFNDYSVGLLHGRMNGLDKQTVINKFKEGDHQILVSTTVVEVGVDIPQATVILIDHAERFGLAQLHQLRGRVGRGLLQSFCVLINDSKSDVAKQRLDVLVNSNDGFEISEVDLRLRGPGQVLGTKQSGLPDFALASLAEDASVLEEARKEANYLLEIDPELNSHSLLKEELNEQFRRLSSNAHLN